MLAFYGITILVFAFTNTLEKIRPLFEKYKFSHLYLNIGHLIFLFLIWHYSGGFQGSIFLKTFTYFSAISFLTFRAQKKIDSCSTYDIFLLILFWVPIDYIVRSLYISNFLVTSNHIAILFTSIVILCIYTISIRQFEDVGFCFKLDLKELIIAFSAIGCIFPLILAYSKFFLDSTYVKFLNATSLELVTKFSVICIISITFELFFNGILLNVLEKTSGKRELSLWICSFMSSIVYFNYTKSNHLSYLLFPLLISYICGRTYLLTNRLSSSIIIRSISHFLVFYLVI